MSKITRRPTAPHHEASIEDRLARLLDTASLARVVPLLPPETLHQIIRHRGLEACGELVTSATPAQLASLLDLDLWPQAHPRRDEQFDVARFGEWLDVLVDTGSSVAARTVAALDTDLVIVGLSHYVRVFDPGTFEPTAQSDDEPMDRDALMRGDSMDVDDTMDGGPTHASHAPGGSSGDGVECHVGGYIIRAQRSDAWDAIVALLVALEAEHDDCFHAVMQGCRRLSNSRPESDDLDDLLLAPQQHLHDAAIEREFRRSHQGHATPADARAFLQMARQPKHTPPGAPVTEGHKVNPIVAAYFRAADEALESKESAQTPGGMLTSSTTSRSTSSRSTNVQAETTVVPESLEAVFALLTEAGMMPERPRALLEAPGTDRQAARLTRVRRLMEYVRDTDEAAYLARSRELAFAANTLLAGCSVQSRPFTPQEASDAAASTCNLGLEYWPARWPGVTSRNGSSPRARDTAAAAPRDGSPPDSFLVDHDLVTAFEVGWSVLYQEVSLFVAKELIATLDDLHSIDRETRRGLVALRRALVKQRDAGTPWLARGAADVLAMCDATAWISVLGLLDECPV